VVGSAARLPAEQGELQHLAEAGRLHREALLHDELNHGLVKARVVELHQLLHVLVEQRLALPLQLQLRLVGRGFLLLRLGRGTNRFRAQ